MGWQENKVASGFVIKKVGVCPLCKSGKRCLAHPSEEELSVSLTLFYVLKSKYFADKPSQEAKVALTYGMANT